MAMTPLPTPAPNLQNNTPEQFTQNVDALLGALPAFVNEANALEDNVNAKELSADNAAQISLESKLIAEASAQTASTKAQEASASAASALNSKNAVLNVEANQAIDVLNAIKTVDGSGSGLDADLLDGMQTGQSGGSYILHANASGNVGIGTDSPVTKFDIATGALGTAAGDRAYISRYITNVGNLSYLDTYTIRESAGSDWYSTAARIQHAVDDAPMEYIQFGGSTNPAGISLVASDVPTRNIALTSVGNALIGKTSDNGVDKLQVNGSISAGGAIKSGASTGLTYQGGAANRDYIFFSTGYTHTKLTLTITGISTTYFSMVSDIKYFNLYGANPVDAARSYILTIGASTLSYSRNLTEVGVGVGSQLALGTFTPTVGKYVVELTFPAGGYPEIYFSLKGNRHGSSPVVTGVFS
jgi:hypothetical protein